MPAEECLTSSCEATLFKLNSSPGVLLLGPADSVCLAGTAEGFGEQCHENGPALLHGCLRCCVCGGDRPPIPRENWRRASGSAFVLPHWFTADGPADFKHRSQGIMMQICSFVRYAKNAMIILISFYEPSTLTVALLYVSVFENSNYWLNFDINLFCKSEVYWHWEVKTTFQRSFKTSVSIQGLGQSKLEHSIFTWQLLTCWKSELMLNRKQVSVKKILKFKECPRCARYAVCGFTSAHERATKLHPWWPHNLFLSQYFYSWPLLPARDWPQTTPWRVNFSRL